jgi:hypothetical protein
MYGWVSGGVIELAGLISNVWLIGLCGLLHFVVLVAVNWMGSCRVIDLVGLISNVWGGCIFGHLIQLIASPEVQQRDVNGDGSKLSPAQESVNQPPWLWQGTSFLTKLGGESLTICFLLWQWDPPNQGAWYCVHGIFGKLLTRRGALVWFHDVWTCGVKVLEYWMIILLKIILNHIQIKYEELGCAFGIVGQISIARFNWIDFETFGLRRMWEISKFKWKLQENQVLEGKINWKCDQACKSYLTLQK